MNLVIVESPAKAKKIAQFLGKDYEAVASYGHIRDLPKSRLGVDLKTFEPEYEVSENAGRAIKELKKKFNQADKIFLATDPDREGEAIAWHLLEILQPRAKKLSYSRVIFHEITKEAVKKAFAKPGELNLILVDAQQARRVLDRLVGYKLSPLLWQKVKRGLSAGRVQSIAVRFVVEREREREKFKEEEYFTIKANFQKDKSKNKSESFWAELKELESKPIEEIIKLDLFAGPFQSKRTTIKTENQAQKIIIQLKKEDFWISEVEKRRVQRRPLPPFVTSTLQQETSSKLHFSPKRTMHLAQMLYENGFITYMRTDSSNLAESAVQSIRKYISQEFESRYLPPKATIYQTKSKTAQEAHEAIRPTDVYAKEVVSGLSRNYIKDADKLYQLIWKRTIACQMAAAEFDQTTLSISSDSSLFKVTGSVKKFDGWLKIYANNIAKQTEDTILPEIKKDDKVKVLEMQSEPHLTTKPPRYTEASLIKELEKNEIGRPSTYAPTISTIEDRYYIEKEEGQIKPTEIGISVNDFLVKYFSDVVNIPFTAKMEKDLDKIAWGEKKWKPIVKEFYEPFSKKLKSVEENASRVKIKAEKTDEICEKCGAKMVVKIGRFGKFLSCSKYPDCDFKKPFLEKIGLNCPKCKEGEVIIRKTKRGRLFYGCSRYPECDFASWKDPRRPH